MRLKWPSSISPVVALGISMTVIASYICANHHLALQYFENRIFDSLMKITAKDPQSGKVAIVDLDEASLAELGQWPWPRYRVAELVDKIIGSGAAVVGLDIIFAEPDRTSPDLIVDELNRHFTLTSRIDGLPPQLVNFDDTFAATLKNKKVVLGCYMQPTDDDVSTFDPERDKMFRQSVSMRGPADVDISRKLYAANDVTCPIDKLYGASRVGFVNAGPDPDNIVRRNPLIWAAGEKRTYSALSLEVIRMFFDAAQVTVVYDDQGVQGLRVKDLFIPTDGAGQMMINYRKLNPDLTRGLSCSFPTYSAKDILNGSKGASELKGKLVFVGTSAVGLKDIKACPLTQYFSGVEVHATIVDNILSQQVLSYPTYMLGVHLVAIILIGAFLTMSIARGKSWLSFLVSLGVIALSIAFSMILLTKYQLVFTPAWVCFVTATMHPTLTTVRFWQEERQKRHVRNMFGTMVSKSVLEYMETNPDSFTLSGKRAEATIFFSDVKGFTTISESLEPEKLSELLNRYLSPMTEIVMKRSAYVDKYIGDAVMAVWGVPYAVQDHALQGCLAALEQQEKLAEIRPILKEQFGHEIKVRMGLNSGVVTAGNMGSDRKFSFTVMGDAVNQAARFEPSNKDYGTQIIIGETTFEAAKSGIEARLLDRILVQGKTKPIRIFELVGRKGAVAPAKMELIRKFEEALELHWNREWDAAEEGLEAILAGGAEDSPSVNLLTRIRYYRVHPPGAAWGGEYIRAAKD